MLYEVQRPIPHGWSTDTVTTDKHFALRRRNQLIDTNRPARVIDVDGYAVYSSEDLLGFEKRHMRIPDRY